jgi:DNA-binding NtrC family response regulator
MTDTTALLISKNRALIATCERAIDAIPALHLEVVSELCEADPSLQELSCPLILVHLPNHGQTAELIRIVGALASRKRTVAIVVIAEQHDGQVALSLLQAGVADYLSRPLDLNRLAYMLDNLTLRARYAEPQPVPAAVQCVSRQEDFLYIDGGSVGHQMEQLRRVAPQETTILLSGETGTGKTRIAQLIHQLSPRRQEPLLIVNCAALAVNLIESEMFGHVKGAFTGADHTRTGKFADVGAGTLVLDEIDALPLAMQAKLLRVIEDRLFEPVGSNKSLSLRARLIAASNRSLEEEVAAGRFRTDLHYRLNVVGFYLPPLRERRPLIQPLAVEFLNRFAARNNCPAPALSAAVLRILEAYDWPGNIRELRNVIERAVALSGGPEIQPADLPDTLVRSLSQASPPLPLSQQDPHLLEQQTSLHAVRGDAEATYITEVLRKHGNNRLRAAGELGISRMTLYRKLRRYGLIDV